MSSLLLDTLKGKPTSRPPVWFMRQAGRVIPEYLTLREKYSFRELMTTPELAADVTVQPVDRLEVDAAIIFADILVIPEAMGMEVDYTDKGPKFPKPLFEAQDPLSLLSPNPIRYEYVLKALETTQSRLPENIPLIGFAGAPLSVFLYMVQGLSGKHTFPDAMAFFFNRPQETEAIFERITELTIQYARDQVSHGAQVFQIFETHCGILPEKVYLKRVLPYVSRITQAVSALNIPVIYFPKDLHTGLAELPADIADFISIDWYIPLEKARQLVPASMGLQGNLDPRILLTSPDIIRKSLEEYLAFGRKHSNWIFNLGHGVIPGTPVENARFVVDWIKQADWQR